MARRTDILEHKEQILKWIEQQLSKKEIACRLQCKIGTLNTYLKKMNIEYEGQEHSCHTKFNRYIPSSYYTNDSSHNIESFKLKQKLIKEGIKKEQCEICGLTEWQGQKIPLELHHINGNRYDNSLENLQVLCPNCHSLQEYHCGKNAGRYHPYIHIKKDKDAKQKSEKQKSDICKSCGCKIGLYTKNNLCPKCFAIKRRKIDRPSREKLKEEIRTNSFVSLSKKYGVSDKAICKWCISYGLPSHAKEIKNISDKDWLNI